MAQHYSNLKGARDPYTLPDLETFTANVVHIECRCGDYDIADGPAFSDITCPSCERTPESVGYVSNPDGSRKQAWFWWPCLPGCLPDGAPNGPFRTEADALADARDGCEEEEDD